MRILLVEDDSLLAEGIVTALEIAGHAADHVTTGEHALHALKSEYFDLVILDLGLPKMSGFEVLKHLRDQSLQVPVLILSARDTIEDKVKGLDLGADDYLLKPFSVEELKARLRALVRRQGGDRTPDIIMGRLKINPSQRKVSVDGTTIQLTPKEYALLHELCIRKQQVLSKEQLLQALYGWGEEIESNSIEVHIHKLRKKVRLPYIKTVRGVGYMMEV